MDRSKLKGEQLKREAAIEELEELSLFLDSDPDRIESLSLAEVAKELTEMKLDPHQSLPSDILQMISRDQASSRAGAGRAAGLTARRPHSFGDRRRTAAGRTIGRFQTHASRLWESIKMDKQAKLFLAGSLLLIISVGAGAFLLTRANSGAGPPVTEPGTRGIPGDSRPGSGAHVARVDEGRRVALVIGNAAYQHPPLLPLRNSTNDATDIAAALEELRFTVTLRTEIGDKYKMHEEIQSWCDNIQPNDVALFYYAGHGAQCFGKNFLLPTGTLYKAETDIQEQGESLDDVMSSMSKKRDALNIIILDACRSEIGANTRDRWAQDSKTQEMPAALARGLAVVQASTGTYVAFATAPGERSSDGLGRNGLFTQYLLRHIATPGVKIEEMFKRVRLDVLNDASNHNGQRPWDASSLEMDFYFKTETQPPTSSVIVPAAGSLPIIEIGRLNSLDEIIKKIEVDNVRESCNTEACCCFTNINLKDFINDRISEQIVGQLRSNQQFSSVLSEIGRMAPDERERLLNRCSTLSKQTWEERLEISCEGQTVAGQRAERMIAKAIVDLVRESVR